MIVLELLILENGNGNPAGQKNRPGRAGPGLEIRLLRQVRLGRKMNMPRQIIEAGHRS